MTTPVNHHDNPPPDPSPEALQGSLALAFDPTDPLPAAENALPIPLSPTSNAEVAPFSPLWAAMVAFILLGGLIGVIFLASAEGDSAGGFIAASPPISCQVLALQDVNVRAGPGFEYPREWIWPSGEIRPALARRGADWLQVANGWIPRQGIELTTAATCNQLPEAPQETLFKDDLNPPDEVLDLAWNEILSENFASNLNEWLPQPNSGSAAIREGQLILFAGQNSPTPPIFPRQALAYQALEDAYFAWAGEWIASDLGAEALFLFRQSEQGYYELSLRRDGLLTLQRWDDNGQATLLEQVTDAALRQDQFSLGLLLQGGQIKVYINGDLRFRSADDGLSSGLYALGLRGQNASFSISRFEVKTPLTEE